MAYLLLEITAISNSSEAILADIDSISMRMLTHNTTMAKTNTHFTVC